MEAEIRSFDIKNLPFTVRFGLGSTEPIKKWARFEMSRDGELYWTRAIDVRKDVNSSNIHTTVHKSGEIHTSRYSGKGEEQKKHFYSGNIGNMGSPLTDITSPHQISSENELFEPGYLYYGLRTLTEKDKKTDTQNRFVACLDELLVNSRLYSSFTLVPWINEEKIVEYLMAEKSHIFVENDLRCHLFTFRSGIVSITVTMKFTAGDSPLDIEKVFEADKNAKPLKRLFHHEALRLSESVSIKISSHRSRL